jgi:hypothetical protein
VSFTQRFNCELSLHSEYIQLLCTAMACAGDMTRKRKCCTHLYMQWALSIEDTWDMDRVTNKDTVNSPIVDALQ